MLLDGWRILPLAAFAVAPVYAAEYMSVEAAQRAAFPDAQAFVPVAVNLSADDLARLAQVAHPPGGREPRIWRAMNGAKLLGTFFADAVIGKQEYISYALALDADGRVLRLDVLEYRETHGWEIRNERWRAQFVGKSAADAVEVSRDIANISGATLSCRHVTDGVRRLLALNALLPSS
jgi:Na+-translocating ferredoxin:NAD+ oxidoreductase RnfG subunit